MARGNGKYIAAAIIGAAAIGTVGYVMTARGAPTPPPGSVLTAISISTSATAIQLGSSVTISGTCTDQTLAPFPGASVSIRFNGTQLGTATSNASGIFSVAVTPISAATFTVVAVSGTVTSNTQTVTVSQVVTPVLTTIVITANTLSPTVGVSDTITITTKDQNGAAIAVASGTVSEGGTSVSTFSTGQTGVGTVGLTFTATGVYTVTASSGGITSNSLTITAGPVLAPVTFDQLVGTAGNVPNLTMAGGGFLWAGVTNNTNLSQSVVVSATLNMASGGSHSSGSGLFTLGPNQNRYNLEISFQAWVGGGAYTGGTATITDANGGIISTAQIPPGTL